MGDILKPRYEYANETSVLPEGDSQSDKAIEEAAMAGIREKIWDAYKYVPSAEIVPSVDPKMAKTLSYEEVYADWNVAGFTFADDYCEEDIDTDTDNTLDAIDNFAPSHGGRIHQRIGSKDRSRNLGKRGVSNYKSIGLSPAAIKGEQEAAKAQEAKFKAVAKEALASKPTR